MTGVEMPFALPWIVFAVAWASIGFVAIVVARASRPLLSRVAAEQRATLLLALALLPLIVATLVTALGFLPKIGGLLVDRHCHPDVGCVAHIPMLHTTVTHATLLAAILFVATGSLLWSIGGRLRRSIVLMTTLTSLAERSERAPFKIVESRERFAYCVGLLKPELLVSRGVLELPAAQRDAVIAHELAHAARRDNLRRWLAGVSLWPLPKRASSGLLGEIAAANEQACDCAASEACGRRHVADTLAKLGAHGLDGSQITANVDDRLKALADPPRIALPRTLMGALILAAYATCALAALDAAHHGTELMLGWLG